MFDLEIEFPYLMSDWISFIVQMQRMHVLGHRKNDAELKVS